jgi:hypothetical protein
MPIHSFQRLVDTLQQPSESADSKPYWPYPLPEAEMIARYGLRCLTPDERSLFPGLRLVLQIAKVQLTKPPAVRRWPERVGRSASSAEPWSGLPKPIQVTI